jgi:hypothetical protein
LTVIGPDGRIIFHDPNSSDKNIYLSTSYVFNGNTDGLPVIGQERSGVDYSVGNYFYSNGFDHFTSHINYATATGRIDNNYAVEEFIFTILGAKGIWGLITTPKRLSDLLKSAKALDKTKGKTTLWEKPGSMKDAIKDFESLKPKDVKIKQTPNGILKTGKLEDGSTATVREFSSDTRPTLEVRNPSNGRGHEIRYGTK